MVFDGVRAVLRKEHKRDRTSRRSSECVRSSRGKFGCRVEEVWRSVYCSREQDDEKALGGLARPKGTWVTHGVLRPCSGRVQQYFLH